MKPIRLVLLGIMTAVFLAGINIAVIEAKPKIIRDMCNQQSGGGLGQSCPTDDHLLVRPKYSDGTCGDWMCCPPNGDGTYDCTKATPPTRSAISSDLKNLLGPRATVLDPGRNPGTTRQPNFQQNAPIMRRGVEEGSSDSGMGAPEPPAPEAK
ncbi:hypothetical protein W02_03490 [Nitrospira sp. KM1]|uniref:hypothetical protein n=1 Tax=Nitrospira sp. KM1 TaxID=1936990 RepID=UPI0013A7683A|nr:hypothetical protein [Nitrospira sp. KM1]BCA53209.1 hypothetical protein W02_03490 [Nitrospira sp. KM1]